MSVNLKSQIVQATSAFMSLLQQLTFRDLMICEDVQILTHQFLLPSFSLLDMWTR